MHLLLADSEVASLHWSDTALHIRLSAAQVLDPAGDAPRSPGYRTGVTLVLGAARVQHEAGLVLGRITDGHVLNQRQRLHPLTVPGEWQGELLVTLDGGQRFALTVAAASLRITVDADSGWHTSYAC